MIVINNLEKISWKRPILNKVNLQISNGIFGILGPNGAGKTTLLKLIAGV
ncbi:ATP-binding cassette domain-containing protein, partial [Streptomyces californicus]